ncbi:YggT family protein [Acidaminobacter hydrogenoformans]|uniref:PEP-CTERM protein-sorting domain-containing protein n=1 Tax=Acidaminobacter hydrogenoformans DSM 2784 TaxID=1120920 RepID=A0A1G5S468_9FIRM|nr:YggT family protein [Acidaminobacter hydrogenoformans]SCZ80947.1 PEP-CTERM protein-sorting domain-containing protein [Acidaminobacter hydrogenoformans DSM 2784]
MTRQTTTRNTFDNNQLPTHLFSVFFGIVESLLAFRLIFKLLGANAENGFVSAIYGITKPIVSIFEGIFSSAVTEGLETASVLEPATVIAMIVVALIAWITFKLITLKKSSHVEKTEYTNVDRRSN